MVKLHLKLQDEVERAILPRHERDMNAAQRAVDRVVLYQPAYPLPARAARLEGYAFVLGYMAHQ